mmetsp:Transcript_39531/g.76835  ORF Transcript_39531/g.76835 Transcript_39531/m.76835 type:complete len:316 (-) Transcript_39531:492-1439(-)
MFFYGIGSVLVRPQENSGLRRKYGPFVADTGIVHRETRDNPGFRPLGAKVFFDSDQNVTGVYDYYKKKYYVPGDCDWEAAKFMAKTSAFTLITFKHHLMWVHHMVSSVVVFNKVKFLPPDHPIRRLLTMFTLRASRVNILANFALIPDHSPIHRATAIPYEEYSSLLEVSARTNPLWQPFPDYVDKFENTVLGKLAEEDKFPFFTLGVDYWHVVQKFVHHWVEETGMNPMSDGPTKAFYRAVRKVTKQTAFKLPRRPTYENLVTMLTQFIWVVTGFHELVGTVVEYTRVRYSHYSHETSAGRRSLCERARRHVSR